VPALGSNPFDSVTVKIRLSKEDPLFEAKVAAMAAHGHEAGSIKFPVSIDTFLSLSPYTCVHT
jgi:hypothetical protein